MIGPSGDTVIDVSDLAVAFERNRQWIPVVNGISFQLQRGEFLRFLENRDRGRVSPSGH